MIFWFFGYPGSGKDYCAKVLKKLIKADYINTDDFLTKRDRQKHLTKSFTVQDRLNKLKRIVQYIKRTTKKKPTNILIADGLPDNKSQNFIYKTFIKNITFILVKTSSEMLRSRLENRKNHFFTYDLLKNWVQNYWQEPKIPHIVLENNENGKGQIAKKLKSIVAAYI